MKKILSALIFVSVCFASVASYAEIGRTETKREREKREREMNAPSSQVVYEKIQENFLKENYSEVNKLSNNYLAGNYNRPNTQDVLYLQALSLLKLGKGEEARAKLRDLEKSYTSRDKKASASVSIADSYYYENNFQAALQNYKKTSSDYPNSDQSVYIASRVNELSGKLGLEQTPMMLVGQPMRQFGVEENGLYSVQVGSFAKQKNAKTLLGTLLQKHFDAYVERDHKDRLFRVRVGHLNTSEEAKILAERLKKEGYSTKIFP